MSIFECEIDGTVYRVGESGLYNPKQLEQEIKIGYHVPAPPSYQVKICEYWVKRYGREIKNIDTTYSSISFEAFINDWLKAVGKYDKMTRVTEGAFIVAACNSGLIVKPKSERGGTAHVNLSRKAIEDFKAYTKVLKDSRRDMTAFDKFRNSIV